MIVILKHEARQEQIDRLKQFLLGMGLRIDESKGENSTILGLVGDTTRVDADLISSLDAVEAVRRVQEPYKKANRKFHPQDTMVDCGGVTIGAGSIIAAAHRHAGGKPTVVPDGDGFGILQRMAAVGVVCIGSFFGDKRMVGRGQRHIGSNEYIVPQRNGRYIQKHTFVVDKAVLPHMDVHAVFAVKRRKNLEIPAHCGWNQLLQRPLLGLCPPQRDAVEAVAAQHARPMPLRYLRIRRVIEPPRHHAFPFIFMHTHAAIRPCLLYTSDAADD